MEIGNKMIKLNWKYRIIGAILIGSIYSGTLYVFDFFENIQTLKSLIYQGLFFGVVMCIGFPFILEKFGTRLTSKIAKNIEPDLEEDERIEIEGPANLFRGIEGVGGKIFLTNKKLIFKSHKLNIQKGQTELEYSIISEIIKRKTAKLINNGLRIITLDNAEFDFVVNEREVWIEKLNGKIK